MAGKFLFLLLLKSFKEETDLQVTSFSTMVLCQPSPIKLKQNFVFLSGSLADFWQVPLADSPFLGSVRVVDFLL